MKTKISIPKVLLYGFMAAYLVIGFSGMALPASAQTTTPPANTPPTTTTTPATTSTTAAAPTVAKGGPEDTIREILCTPTDYTPNESLLGGAATNPAKNDLYICINKAYRFAIVFSAFVGVLYTAIAGYMYMSGAPAAIKTAKEMIIGVITGLIILFISYIFLRQINPDLVKFKTIQPPEIAQVGELCPPANIVQAADGSFTCGAGGPPVTATGAPIGPGTTGGTPAERGQCTVANVSECTAWHPNEAVAVCNAESKGNTAAQSGTDKCDNFKGPDGSYLSFSYGLMQVSLTSMGGAFPQCANILNYPTGSKLREAGQCPGGFGTAQNGTSYCKRRLCTAPRGEAVLQECARLLLDKSNNIKAACSLYSKSCWKPWPDTGKVVQNYNQCPR